MIKRSLKIKRAHIERALVDEEFKLYYQPQLSIQPKVSGLEALIRWQHPDYGILPPASFLPVAEKSDLIIQIEKWVLCQAIADMILLENHGVEDLNLSVNISACQFENEHFLDLIQTTLDEHHFSPERLTLEITERFLVKERNIEQMQQLKSTGVRLSIDDFGTSHASLQYLRDLPVDELKIDRSFIANIHNHLKDEKIVAMLIRLGHELDLQVVGEGVETEAQFHMLQEMRCDRVQGYLFCKPQPLHKIHYIYENTNQFQNLPFT